MYLISTYSSCKALIFSPPFLSVSFTKKPFSPPFLSVSFTTKPFSPPFLSVSFTTKPYSERTRKEEKEEEERNKLMGDFTLTHRRYVNSGQRIGIIDDKAYAVNNVYVIRAHNNNNNNNFATNMMESSSHNNSYQMSKSSYNNKKGGGGKNRAWYSTPEFNRKKRVAKYKIYSMEGKVKRSFKNGYRWLKHTCSRIIHGF